MSGSDRPRQPHRLRTKFKIALIIRGYSCASDTMADPESSFELLEGARAGDPAALDRLLSRYLSPLQRWASGRLPRWARDLSDTGDLVQETLIRTLRNIGSFRPEREGALQAYLRQ